MCQILNGDTCKPLKRHCGFLSQTEKGESDGERERETDRPHLKHLLFSALRAKPQSFSRDGAPPGFALGTKSGPRRGPRPPGYRGLSPQASIEVPRLSLRGIPHPLTPTPSRLGGEPASHLLRTLSVRGGNRETCWSCVVGIEKCAGACPPPPSLFPVQHPLLSMNF